MSTLLMVLVLAADAKSDTTVSVDSVTVNGEPTTAKASGAAATASTTGQQWSVVTARTLGSGANALQGGFGFPGVYAQFMHGIMQSLDLGGRVAFNYGVEGQVACDGRLCRGGSLQPGVKVQAVARYKFFDNGKLNAGASFAPGPIFIFDQVLGTQVGFAIPVAATLGIVVSPAMNVGVTVEVPLWIKFGNRAGLALPILAGAGFEYFITSALAAFFELRMGPTVWAGNNLPAVFTFHGNLGVGWRF